MIARKDFAINLSMWICIIMAFGYPLQATIPLMLGLDSAFMNVVIRFIYALLLILSLTLNIDILFQKKEIWTKTMLIFLFIYLCRLIYDILFRNIIFNEKPDYFVFSMFIGNGILPFLVISSFVHKYNLDKIPGYIYWTVFISNISILIMVFIQNNTLLSLELFDHRANITDANDNLIFNTILIGTYGNILASISLYGFLFLPKKRKYIFSFFVGFFIIIMAASRGPLLYFLVITILILSYYIYINKRKAILFIFGFIIFSIISLSKLNISLFEFSLFQRINYFIDDRKTGVKEARDYEWEAAWDQFLTSPFIGDCYLNSYDNFYPHNIILDVLMSTGIIGFILFLLFVICLIKQIKIYVLFRCNKQIFISIAALILFLSTFTSGGLFSIHFFWASIPLIFITPLKAITKNRKLLK